MTRILLGICIGLAIFTFQAKTHNQPGTAHNRQHAITWAFCHSLKPCPLGEQAVRVARCESGPRLWNYANNSNTYLGMFQAGPFMRSKYGFSWSPWAQARQAYRYWLDSGWSPWECRP